MNSLEKIGLAGLVPVVVIDNADDAVPAAEALLQADLQVMEITMRTQAGIQAIKNVAAACPEMLVGAGTILSLEKCQEAVAAGAKFIVSPGFNEKIVSWCVENDVPITPGCVTPTEIEQALAYGIRTVKFFPADVYGGAKACKALYGPYRAADVSFIPTGGVNNDNLAEYADKPYIHAVGGGWLCQPKAVNSHDFAAITTTACQAIDILLGFEIAHLGINQENSDTSLAVAEKLQRAFGFPLKQGSSSNFAGSYVEVMKENYLGRNGHLAIRTNSIKRAVYYLQLRGFAVDEKTAKYKGDNMIAVYLKDEFGGFAVHLLQK